MPSKTNKSHGKGLYCTVKDPKPPKAGFYLVAELAFRR